MKTTRAPEDPHSHEVSANASAVMRVINRRRRRVLLPIPKGVVRTDQHPCWVPKDNMRNWIEDGYSIVKDKKGKAIRSREMILMALPRGEWEERVRDQQLFTDLQEGGLVEDFEQRVPAGVETFGEAKIERR